MLSSPGIRSLGQSTQPFTRCQAVAALLLFFVLLAPATQAQTSPCSNLLITGNSEYPPFLWQPESDSNKLEGAVPALLKEAFQSVDIELTIRHIGSWARVQKLARTGDIDMVAGAFMTEERLGYLDYVYPAISEIPTVVWFPKGREFEYTEWSDLIGKVGSTLIGNSFGQAFDQYAEAHLAIEGVRSIEQSFRMAKADRVDYVLYEALQGKVKLAKYNWLDDFTASNQFISVENLYFAFPKNSACNTPALRVAFADALEKLHSSGRVHQLIEQYTTEYVNQL